MIEEKTILNEYGEKIFVEVYVPTVISNISKKINAS